MAAADALGAAERLGSILSGRLWPDGGRKRPPALVSIGGCSAGTGFGCGTLEYADLSLTGRRKLPPSIDQEIAALSPRLSILVTGCPGRALRSGREPGEALALEPAKCLRCGWCASQDPALGWPGTQGGHFSVELSGRRTSPPYEHVPVRTLWAEIPGGLDEIAARLADLIGRWRLEALEGEILADFLGRTGLDGGRPDAADDSAAAGGAAG
jgi:dissimilatory sulfite reductase (desulfoviridin) alpha/beta subunit